MSDSFRSVAWLNRGLTSARAIAQLIAPETMATGFLVDPAPFDLPYADRLLLSVNSIVDPGEDLGSIEVRFQGMLDDEVSPSHVQIAGKLWEDPENDAALYWLSGSPGDVAPLHFEPARVGIYASIIGYDPSNGEFQLSLDRFEIDEVEHKRLLYSTSTVPGFAGSPIFDPYWNVIGMHCKVDASGEKRYGVAVREVLSDLLRSTPEQGDEPPTPPPTRYETVFIGHDEGDRVLAQKIEMELSQRGVRVFLATSSRFSGHVGDKLREEIHSKDRYVLVCTRAALTESIWVDRELTMVLGREEDLQKKTREKPDLILPLDVDGSLRKIQSYHADMLKSRAWIDFSDHENRLSELVDDLASRLRS